MTTFRRLRHKAAHSRIRVPLIWLRHRGLDSSDVFLASYPRSGNTWLRFLLMEILSGKSAEFDTVNSFIPEMGIHGKTPGLLPGGGRLIKTHERYRREYNRAVYVYRDVRDVLLSDFSRTTQLGLVDLNLDAYITPFFCSQDRGIGSWEKHVLSWLDSPLSGRGDLHLVRFEDMRKNPEQTLTSIVEFLGLKVDRSAVQRAVASNTIARMREKENRSDKLPKSTQERGRFVRQGAVSGWRSRLTEKQLQLVEQHAGEVLRRLGYPLAGVGGRDSEIVPVAKVG
jgi:Sulfotransferase domain